MGVPHIEKYRIIIYGKKNNIMIKILKEYTDINEKFISTAHSLY